MSAVRGNKSCRFQLHKITNNKIGSYGNSVSTIDSAVTGAGGSGYVNTAGKTMFQMKETGNFIGSLKTSAGLVGGGQAQMMPLAFDPAMLFMAAALANIDKKQ